MKRVIAFVLTFVMALGLYNCYPISAASTPTLTKEQETLLTLFGVIDDKADWDKIITKGEFAELISKVAFERNGDVSTYVGESNGVFDMKKGQKYFNEVTALYNRGFIATDKFGCFYPNNELTMSAAFEIILRTIGYSENTPYVTNGYTALASKKGIDKGIVFDKSGKISLFNAYLLIFNMLKCNMTDLKFLTLDHSDNELIYMTARLGIYEINGVVTDDGITTLYGDTKAGEGHIVVDNGDPMINDTGRNDLLGMYICGYFLFDHMKEYTLISAFERTGKNTVTEILSKNIESFSGRTYTYLPDEFATVSKKIKVPTSAIIIYNGRPLGISDPFTPAMFVPANGVVKLYDNDGDGDADIVRIENYETEIVELVNNKEETIYVKNGRPFYSLADMYYDIYDTDGNKLKLADIAADSVISVMTSLDNQHYKIVVSTESQVESAKSYYAGSASEYAYVLTSSGGKYCFTDYAKTYYGAPQLGNVYKFVFDMFDNVAGYFKDETNYDWQYGYFVALRYNEESDNDEYFARIYTQLGDLKNYTVYKKLRIIEEGSYTYNSYKPENAVAKLQYTSYDGSTKSKESIVRFRVNTEGLLTDLELPYNLRQLNTTDATNYAMDLDYGGPLPTQEDRLYCLVDTASYEKCAAAYKATSGYEESGDYVAGEVANSAFTYGGAAFITSKTKGFKIPNHTDEYDLYSLLDYSFYSTGKTYPLYVFGTSCKNKIAKCVQYTSDDSSSFVKSFENEWPSVVSDVYKTYDERKNSEIYTVICGETKYFIEKENYESGIKNIAGPTSTSPTSVLIGRGDIIFMTSNTDNYITGAVLAYDADRPVKDKDGTTIIGGIAGAELSYYGKDTVTNKWLCNPFACGSTRKTDGCYEGKEESWKFDSDRTRIFSGWIYSYDDGCLLITNQNLSKPGYVFNPTLKKSDGYLTEAVDFDLSFTSVVEKGARNKTIVHRATTDDIKPYTTYGNNCSRVVVTYYLYALRNIVIYNN